MANKTVHTETSVKTTFSRADLLKALGLPENARVFVQVPGGGDWSNCELEIDTDVPLQADYKEPMKITMVPLE